MAGHFVVPLGCMKFINQYCFEKRTEEISKLGMVFY